MSFGALLAAGGDWNFEVTYLDIPNNRIIINQSFKLSVDTWNDPVFEQPIITPTKFVTYYNNFYKKTLPLFERETETMNNSKYQYNYSSHQINRISQMPMIAQVRFSMILKNGMGWYNQNINLLLP